MLFKNNCVFFFVEISLPLDDVRDSDEYQNENIPPTSATVDKVNNNSAQAQITIENPDPVNDNSYASIVKGDQMIATLTGNRGKKANKEEERKKVSS